MPDDLGAPYRGELVFNGINAVTGEYGRPPMPAEKLAKLIQGRPSPEDYRGFVAHQRTLGALTDLDHRLQRVTEAQLELRSIEVEVEQQALKRKTSQSPMPVKPGGGDPSRVEEVGWAILFPADMRPTLREEIKEALQPLLDLRSSQAGDLFRLCEGTAAYRRGERKDQYCDRIGIGPGAADPQEFPYYVMLVGSPEDIPYQFQYQLDVMRGVGRLDFEDDLEAYAAYACNVVAAETGQVRLPRRMTLFGTANPGDKATHLSSRYLVRPLFENLTGDPGPRELALRYPWKIAEPVIGEGMATRARLRDILGRDRREVPSLLFTATHGLEFPANHPKQIPHQGALLCQDWPGPGRRVTRDTYVAGEDLGASTNLLGMVAMLFACYGAGTPELDQFAMQAFKVRERIAPRGFTAMLPRQMLRRGALAVIGHVERAWGYSFISPRGELEHQAFVTALRSLMNGQPVGLATDASFNLRYAGMSSDLSAALEELRWDSDYLSEHELAHRWTASNDARSYAVIGDPAVRIPFVRDGSPPVDRPELDAIRIPEPEPEPEPEPIPEPEKPEIEAPEPPGEAAVESTVEPEPSTVAEAPEPPSETEVETASEPEPSSEANVAEPSEPRLTAEEISRLRAELLQVQAQTPSPEAWAESFGLKDQVERLRESLRKFTDELAVSLGEAADDMVKLDVRTYSADDIEAASQALADRQEVGAVLRAMTRVEFSGDIEMYVPEDAKGEVDEVLWRIHKGMVEEAQQSRAKFLQVMATLAGHLMSSFTFKP